MKNDTKIEITGVGGISVINMMRLKFLPSFNVTNQNEYLLLKTIKPRNKKLHEIRLVGLSGFNFLKGEYRIPTEPLL